MHSLWKIFQYLKHQLHATSIHGAHSPFLFELFNEVFNVPFRKEDQNRFNAYRKARLCDNHRIVFEEHGAGDNHNRPMTIGQIAHKSSISSKEARILINLTRHLKPASILELGTSTGVSTNAFRIASPEAQITTIEGCTELASYIKNQWSDRNTNMVTSTFDSFFQSPEVEGKKWDLVYLDGNHTYEATLSYYEIIKNKHSRNETCLVFDDIYWSKEMLEAWNKIISDPANSLTLDFFNLGIVFFDQRLSKQHFSIKL